MISGNLPLNPIARWEWVFPVVESLHICGFMLLVGAATVIDLRLLRACLQRLPVSQVAAALSPFLWTGLLIQLVTGPLLFSGDAREYVQVAAFRNKMLALVIAAAFQFFVVSRATAPGRDHSPLGMRTLVAIVSLGLWCTVMLAGMWIGNL